MVIDDPCHRLGRRGVLHLDVRDRGIRGCGDVLSYELTLDVMLRVDAAVDGVAAAGHEHETKHHEHDRKCLLHGGSPCERKGAPTAEDTVHDPGGPGHRPWS